MPAGTVARHDRVACDRRFSSVTRDGGHGRHVDSRDAINGHLAAAWRPSRLLSAGWRRLPPGVLCGAAHVRKRESRSSWRGMHYSDGIVSDKPSRFFCSRRRDLPTMTIPGPANTQRASMGPAIAQLATPFCPPNTAISNCRSIRQPRTPAARRAVPNTLCRRSQPQRAAPAMSRREPTTKAGMYNQRRVSGWPLANRSAMSKGDIAKRPGPYSVPNTSSSPAPSFRSTPTLAVVIARLPSTCRISCSSSTEYPTLAHVHKRETR